MTFSVPSSAAPSSSLVIKMAFGEPPARVDHRGEAALHVGGAAADQRAAVDDGREWVDLPLLARARRDDVRVAGKDHGGGRAASPCPEVVDGAEPEALDRKAGGLQ